MFERVLCQCPGCEAEVAKVLSEKEEFVCPVCSRSYGVMLNAETGKAAFYEPASEMAAPPLFLPTGSIRALTAIAMAVSAWVLMLRNIRVPDALLGLILTAIGYYFGFRAKTRTRADLVYDAAPAPPEQPLFLPTGVVRIVLIVGFGLVGVGLALDGRLFNARMSEFFIVLFGLVFGYLFAKVTRRISGKVTMPLLNHVKAALVLAVTGWLAFIFLTGAHLNMPEWQLSVLCGAVSFYYGSRT